MQANASKYSFHIYARMDFQERFVQVLYNVMPVLQVASGQLSELMSEDVKVGRASRIAELSPVMKFELGPFESADDHFYRDHRYVKTVNLKNKKVWEKLIGLKDEMRPERRKTGNRETSFWEKQKKNSRAVKQKNRLDEAQAKRMHSAVLGVGTPSSSEVSGLVRQISAMKNEVKQFRTMSRLLTNLKTQVHKMEGALLAEPLEKLLTLLEESFSSDGNLGGMKPTDQQTGRNRSDGTNSITYNNQYQIGNVFTINRLSECKEGEGGSVSGLGGRKLGEGSEKIVKEEEGVPRDGSSASAHFSLQKNETDLLNQLERNFSRIFSHQNVSLEQMNQMSKIIDFVERYHGAVESAKASSGLRAVDAGEGRRKSKELGTLEGTRGRQRSRGKVLRDEGFGLLESEEGKRGATVRRKGSV